jgi:predicted peptidase
MGGYGVWYLAYRYPSRFAALVPVCGFATSFPAAARLFTPIVPADSGAPYDALARQLRRVPTWIVHGEIDQVVPVEQSRQAAAAFTAAGAPVQYFEVPGTNHDVWDAAYGSPTLITWLFAQRRSH